MSVIADFVTKCRRKLVDTTMRNRLLNYKPGARGGGIEIVGEHPVAIWEMLAGTKRTMIVRGRGGDDADPIASSLDTLPGLGSPEEAPAEEGNQAEGSSDAFGVGIDRATEAQHRDGFLETGLNSEALATRLRRLADTALMAQQEQGVETLFLAIGFLGFFEADSSDTERRAPLLLLPAALERDGTDRWKVRARDDDPIVNPALVEYLREQHGVTVPQLPESLDAFDPLAWFREVKRLVAAKPRWRVTAGCTLGVFSFQKFVMHEDLRKNVEALTKHEVIEQLATRSGSGSGTPQLPDDVAGLRLDEDYAPESTPQVVDADSTQLRALAAVERRHHLVIEGPPGTGKSQTITNLIAGALASGRTVLFVAEKQAALKVVFDRLKKVGLGPFCFELHSSKANKAAVLKELGRTLDTTLERTETREYEGARLAAVRGELSGYARAVHEVVQPLGISVHRVVGRLSRLSDALSVRAPLRVSDVSKELLGTTLGLLAKLAAAAARVGDVASHPWRDMTRDTLDLDAREAVEEALAALRRLFPEIMKALKVAEPPFGLPQAMSVLGLASLGAVADVLEASPGVEPRLSSDDRWAEFPAPAEALIRRGRALLKAEARAQEHFGSISIGSETIAAADVVEARGDRWWRWVGSAWRSARVRLKQETTPKRWLGAKAAAAEARAAQTAMAERAALNADPEGSAWFGRGWNGADSTWGELESLGSWLVRFRRLVEQHHLLAPVAEVATQPRPSAQSLRRVVALAAEGLTHWRVMIGACGWPANYWEERSRADLSDRVDALAGSPAAWRDWIEFRVLREQAAGGVAGPLIVEAEAGRLAWGDVPRAFERRFYERWLDSRLAASEILRRFSGASHQEKITEFRELDHRILEYHRSALVAKLRQQAQTRLRDPALQPELQFLRDQLGRQRGHRPVRELLQRAGGAIRAVKPCFLMSPMTVALCLEPAKQRFDLVVFDEASQMTPEDAIGAVGRGEQLVVVGDPKQLPPTNFFAVQTGQVEPAQADGAALSFSDLDSVLELALAAGFAGARLRWHYRSRHESLIAYSNQKFYDSTLFTFPSAERDSSVRGLTFQFVPEGCYEGNGVNRAEASRVVDAVIAHAREQPTKSLCVGTFSLPQQLAVQDELERRRRAEPWLEEFLSLDQREPFFVKNLESIQGDERDVVLLSITYGRGPDGRVRNNFGPINGQNGWRRLNVLTTRARERMVVISSMRADDIDVGSPPSNGASLLQEFLRYAETGVLTGGPILDATAGAESPFEEEVIAALARAGIRVQPQVGVSGYRIDIGVVDPDLPGRFICGIECDGVSYHAAESARDRDRLREEVLRGLGWRLHRVWSVDWWHDRSGQTRRLLDLIEKSTSEARATGTPDTPGANVEFHSERDGESLPSSAGDPAAGDANGPRQGGESRTVRFAAYVLARPRSRFGGILSADAEVLLGVFLEVLKAEGPLHQDDLRSRVVAAFGQSRAGARIAERLDATLRGLGSAGVEHDGASWRIASVPTRARTRAGTGITPERIPSWEYETAVVEVLSELGSMVEERLVAAVRDAFGYGSASATLREGVHGAIRKLSEAGNIGIGGEGIGLIAGDQPRGGRGGGI